MIVRRLIPLMALMVLFCGLSAQNRPAASESQARMSNTQHASSGAGSGDTKEKKKEPVIYIGHYTYATVHKGDTIPLYYLNDVNIWSTYLLLTPEEVKKNSKLIRNVKLMLPYAREAKRRLDALEVEIANMPAKERKAALKKAEKDIEAEYTKDLKRRTYSQGLVLIKLIDRETSRSAYSLVSDLRGSFRATLYQACAWLFGYNLKDKFDPENDSKDNLIDRIVKSVDRGVL